jgi:hypothetical protein
MMAATALLDAAFYSFRSEVDDNLIIGRVAKPIQHIGNFGQEKNTRE